MHQNSLNTFHELEEHLNQREKDVLSIYQQNHPTPISDRYVMNALGFSDPNKVRPRITSLRDKKYIVEVGKMRDEETGQNVRHCRLIQQDGDQLELFARPKL